MWRELNKLYLQLCDSDFCAQARDQPHEFYQAVECGSLMFQGVCDATLTHDEGWQFIQLGKFLERADKTLRIVDIQYQVLHDLANPNDLPLASLYWGAVSSCRAYDSFQRLHVGRVEADKVIEFLLLNADFPRSVRFCLEQAARGAGGDRRTDTGSQHEQRRPHPGPRAQRAALRRRAALLRGDLHHFLASVQDQSSLAGMAVQDQYSLR